MKKLIALCLTLCLTVGLMTSCDSKSASSADVSVSAASEISASIQEEASSKAEEVNNEPVSLKDDFYNAVNAEWIAANEIPADKYAIGGFSDIAETVTEQLMTDMEKMADGEIETEDAVMKSMIEYYKLVFDFDARNAVGAEPILAKLEEIEGIDSLEAFKSQIKEWILDGNSFPVMYTLMADMGNAEKIGLYAEPHGLFLPDVSYYEEDDMNGVMVMKLYQKSLKDTLLCIGKTEAESDKIIEGAFAFDKSLVPYTPSAEESADVKTMYNPVSFDTYCAYFSTLDMRQIVETLLGTAPDEVICSNPRFFEAFDSVVNEETFENMKDWLYVNYLNSVSSLLSEDILEASLSYTMALSGLTEMPPLEEIGYEQVFATFGEPLGMYYGKTYFGEKAKADVESMVRSMLDVFKNRIIENTWLSEATKEQALKKLETMVINVGYPEELDPFYATLEIISKEDGGDLICNSQRITRKINEHIYAQYGQPVDREAWVLSAATVNAMYHPLNNSINFSAAILQAPFYSLDQTESENYGGIGAVMAHEITHAFDPNGAEFDHLGNLNNWWTDEDRAIFESLSQKMIDQFEGIEVTGGNVNGTLTVGENIADLGGLTCALEAVKKLPDGNTREMFTNYATIWREKCTEQYAQLRVTMDVHAPNILRANIQLQNIDEFYTAFDIQENDGMYRAPEDRIAIW